MGDFVRRLVSGNKARYKDEELDLELDLAYITDQVIVMGYLATGLEGFYRNRREDAKKFLDHRHGKNYWVFNFCPVKENSYPDSVFEGRVSRYPFPDHHAPPLAVLPLVAREIRLWLDGSSERVAVLHCKAGKGRSGTMACAYLLTLDAAPNAPRLGRSLTEKERAKTRAEQVMDAMPADETADIASDNSQSGEDPIKHEITNDSEEKSASPPSTSKPAQEAKKAPRRKETENSLTHVLELHTARRMKRPSSPSKKLKQGVSIPSQRRWLYYWSLILAHQAPPDFWSVDPEVRARPSPKVKLTQIKLRMRELSGLKTSLVRAVNTLVDTAGLSKRTAATNSSSQVWASLARYDDDFVDTLEEWERFTRDDSGAMGVRRRGADHMEGEAFADLFREGRFDSKKMVRSFARMGPLRDEDIQKDESGADGKVQTLLLRPLTGDKWLSIREKIEVEGKAPAADIDANVESEDTSIYDATQALKGDGGVVVDAHRELRVKLYLGQVFMGWFWFVPTFHMPHPRASGGEGATLVLTRKEVDFPVGIGSSILDVGVSMEWCSEAADVVSPPARQGSAESVEGQGEPTSVAAALQAAASGQVHGLAEAKQAADG
ncbi:phosphatases II [Trametes meyenii]|nr:phosphatases II [Trametes meyenii]